MASKLPTAYSIIVYWRDKSPRAVMPSLFSLSDLISVFPLRLYFWIYVAMFEKEYLLSGLVGIDVFVDIYHFIDVWFHHFLNFFSGR